MTEGVLRFGTLCKRDLPELEQMILGLYQEDSCVEAMSTEKIHRTVAELEKHPDRGTIILFRMGGSIVGYAIVIHLWSNEYGGNIEFIDELFVKPAWRGKGFGSAFLDHLSDAGRGTTKGLLLEVTPANERAYAFYSRHGFEPTRNRHMFAKL